MLWDADLETNPSEIFQTGEVGVCQRINALEGKRKTLATAGRSTEGKLFAKDPGPKAFANAHASVWPRRFSLRAFENLAQTQLAFSCQRGCGGATQVKE